MDGLAGVLGGGLVVVRSVSMLALLGDMLAEGACIVLLRRIGNILDYLEYLERCVGLCLGGCAGEHGLMIR